MFKIKQFTALAIMLSCLAHSQERLLHFKVVVNNASADSINVVNIVNEKSAVTNSSGEFSIRAKPDDLLILEKPSLEYKRRIIEPDDLDKAMITIEMTAKPIALKEVTVTKKTPDDLIKRHSDHRDFTPAERKLYTARSGILDPLLNAISGRTKRLKKQLDVEMKERLLARTGAMFPDDFYTETLKIPSEYIFDFQHFLVDDEEFVTSLRANNKYACRLRATKLAIPYHELLEAVK